MAGVVGAAPGGLGAGGPLQVVQLGDGGGPAHSQRFEDGVALLGRGGQRVANDSAGAEVAGTPGAGGAAVGREQGRIKYGRVVDHRTFHVHGVGGQGQHQCGFAVARVHGQAFFLVGEELARHMRHTPGEAGHHDEVAMAQAQLARAHLHHLRLAAVAVDEQQLAKARAVYRLAHLVHGGQQGLAAQRDGAGEVQVLFGLAVGDGGHRERRHIGRQARQRMAHHSRADHRVHCTRQVRAVLLGGACGQHDDGVFLVGQVGDLGPAQVRQVAVGRVVAVQHERLS
ncbi:hypothetical protein D3C71_1158170 [compost metagenome]